MFRSRIAEGGECVLYLYTATSKQVLRHGPGHWAKDQQDRATYKCPEVCVYVYGRWVRFMFGHDKENRGSPSIQVSHPIRRVHPPRRRATETQYRHKVLYSYSHFSPARYLTLPSPTSTTKLDYRYIEGFCCHVTVPPVTHCHDGLARELCHIIYTYSSPFVSVYQPPQS